MKRLFLLVILVLSFHSLSGQEQDTTVTMLFAGDIMGHDGQIASAWDESSNSYDYDRVFRYITPLISSADIAIGNLEVTLAGPPYKGYPAFSSPDELAAACQKAGFDVLMTANNHSADKGPRGIRRTIDVLDSIGMPHTGTWKNSAEMDSLSPLIVEKNGLRLAFLNYTYGTNGIIVPPPSKVAYIDTSLIVKDIRKAGSKNSDLIVVFIHWGIEYDSIPSAVQKRTAESLFRNGADIIIGSHPHVLQPMEAVTTTDGLKKPLVWSIGNFVSNQRKRRSDGGAVVMLSITKKNNTITIDDAGYILTWVYVPNENGKRQFYVLPCSEYEDNPSFFQNSYNYQSMMVFINDSRRLMGRMNRGFNEYIKTDQQWIEVER